MFVRNHIYIKIYLMLLSLSNVTSVNTHFRPSSIVVTGILM